ncbi:MAG: hypothetical protein DLM72_19900 [Candidatus Nitrosopolaris wilkensis]|nr:MAG: hypothetical protein DLM72_19900 [Candidatus Nitrosopolaris wilkensis]
MVAPADRATTGLPDAKESAVYIQLVLDPKSEEQKRMLDRIFILNYDDNFRLKLAQEYIYYQTFVLH